VLVAETSKVKWNNVSFLFDILHNIVGYYTIILM